MTQTLHAVGGADSKKQRAESNILHVVKVLFTYAGLEKEELGGIIDVSRATVYQRWSAKSAFKTGELALLSEYFGIPAEVFMAGPQALDLGKVSNLAAPERDTGVTRAYFQTPPPVVEQVGRAA